MKSRLSIRRMGMRRGEGATAMSLERFATMARTVLGLLLAGTLVACATRHAPPPIEQIPGWHDESRYFDFKPGTEIPVSDFTELTGAESDSGVGRLSAVKALTLSREQALAEFPLAVGRLPVSPRYLLARASSDLGNGVYSVNFDGRLRVDYFQLGGCGKPHKRAVLIAIDATVEHVFGGCSGAM